MALDPVAIAGITAGLGALGWNVWRDRREKRLSKEHNLTDNPERCADHETRLRAQEKELADIKVNLARVETKVDALTDDVSDVKRKLNGK